MKIIHLSDTHIGSGENTQRLYLVVDDLLKNAPDAIQNCVILHTGDIIDSASAERRQTAKAALHRLQENGYRVILCPGNHDYGDKYAVNNQAANAFKNEFASYLFHHEPREFPVLHLIGDDCALIGLDSNAAELRWWEGLFAEGYLGAAQLEKLNLLLDSDALRGKKIILYLHHHPFYYGYSVMPDVGDSHPFKHMLAWLTRPFRRMKDAYSLCQIIRDRVQVLLFGHMHEGMDCSSESRKYGIRVALDGGSTTDTDNDHDRLRYRIIDLDTLSHSVRMIKISQ